MVIDWGTEKCERQRERERKRKTERERYVYRQKETYIEGSQTEIPQGEGERDS